MKAPLPQLRCGKLLRGGGLPVRQRALPVVLAAAASTTRAARSDAFALKVKDRYAPWPGSTAGALSGVFDVHMPYANIPVRLGRDFTERHA